MYKTKDNEEYKTTTIRIRKDHYNKLKDIADQDHRSTNYIINKILIVVFSKLKDLSFWLKIYFINHNVKSMLSFKYKNI